MEIPASTRIQATFSHRLTQLSCNSGTPQELLEIQTTRVRRARYNSDFASSSEIDYSRNKIGRVFITKARPNFLRPSPIHLRTARRGFSAELESRSYESTGAATYRNHSLDCSPRAFSY